MATNVITQRANVTDSMKLHNTKLCVVDHYFCCTHNTTEFTSLSSRGGFSAKEPLKLLGLRAKEGGREGGREEISKSGEREWRRYSNEIGNK